MSNVFDIEQGVAIGIFVKEPGRDGTARVHHAELWGEREEKYDSLSQVNIETTDWTTLAPQSPFYLFVPQNVDLRAEYERGWKITDAMPVNSLGVTTARDRLTIRWTDDDLKRTVEDFASLPPEEAREKYSLRRDARDWKVALAQADLHDHPDIDKHTSSILYRPFDTRTTYYTGRSRGFMCMPRSEVMHHMLAGKNVGISTIRSVEIGRGFEHVFCSRDLIQLHTVSIKEVNYLFPLWCYPESDEAVESIRSRRRRRLGKARPGAIPSRLGKRAFPFPEREAVREGGGRTSAIHSCGTCVAG